MIDSRDYLRDKLHRDGYCVIENIAREQQLEEAIPTDLSWHLSYYPSEDNNEAGSFLADDTVSYRNKIKYTQERSRELGKDLIMSFAFLRNINDEDALLRDLLAKRFEDISYITGYDITGYSSTFLSKYEQGCYLATHNDEFEPPAPRFAFVLGLTKGWCSHWGGLTIIEGKDPLAATAITPAYNALMIFKVPVWHMVSEVNNCAAHSRLAFSGWFKPSKVLSHSSSSFWNTP
tara:strand:+ start:2779 stop:3477 length:699 start_codon:yes stop_codon:yes gene_type:complete